MDDHTLSDWDYTRPLPSENNRLDKIMYRMCVLSGVKVHWRAHGYMVALKDVPQLIRCVIANYKPKSLRFDRASLLVWLLGLENDIKWRWNWGDIPETWFERQLNGEVHRIAQLEEPARTVAAVELVSKFQDASVLTQAVIAGRKVSGKPRNLGGYHWWKRLRGMAHADEGDAVGQPRGASGL